MTNQNSSNTSTTADNTLEKTHKKADTSVTTQAIRKFIEHKLLGPDGGKNFNEMKFNRGNGLSEDFLKFIASQPDFDKQSNEQKEAFKNVDNLQFLRETLSIGAGFESKRKALINLYNSEYPLSEKQKKVLLENIEKKSLDELSSFLRSESRRNGNLEQIFAKKTPTKRIDKERIEKMFDGVTLNSSQEEAISNLFLQTSVENEDIEEIISLFQSPGDTKTRQLLVKMFLPTVTLGELKDIGILDKHQAEEVIRESLEKGGFGGNFSKDFTDSEKEDMVRQIDPYQIVIPTALFPDDIVTTILNGPGKKAMRDEFNHQKKIILDEFASGNELGLTPDKDGKLLPSFIERLRKDLKLPHAEFFQKGNFIRGKTKDMDGKEHPFYLVIDEISDDPKVNKETNGNGKFITVRNILTADGQSIDKNWKAKKGTGTPSSYFDLYALIKQGMTEKGDGKGVELSTQAMMDKEIEEKTLSEKILSKDIKDLAQLNEALDKIDAVGTKYPLAQGSNIQVGKPGNKDFWVFTIKSINESKNGGTIAVSKDGKSEESYTYDEFLDNFEVRNGTRLPKMDTPEEFLFALQNHGEKAKEFGEIMFDKDRGFIPKDKKDDKDFPSITQFVGQRDTISMFDGVDPLGNGWIRGEWQEDAGKKTGKYKNGALKYNAHYNALFAHFLETKATPKISATPINAPEKEGENMDMESGFFKSYFGNPSLHAMFTGAKNLIDFVKDKLEHGSKLEAAKFQLALGKKLGFTDAMMRELRNKVYGNTRELMEKMVKDLSDLPAGERQKEVEHILKNKGSHDYEIQAVVLAMLKKHGRLYVGTLQKYEGSFIFFERITGQKYDPNSTIVKKITAKAEERGVPMREEFMIQTYIQMLGGADGGYGCDSGLWVQIRNSWEEGIKNEKEAGAKQAEQGYSTDQRLFFPFDKFGNGEVAQGIGAMKTVWSKGGSGPEMHLPAMYITLSSIPDSLHTNQTNELYNEFKSNAHPYPALAFLHRPEKVVLFQKVVEKLCEKDPDMKKDYAVIKKEREKNNLKATIVAIREFWTKYGTTLHKKLVMSEDPEILFRAEKDPDFANYVGHMRGFTHKLAFNKEEIKEKVYNYDHSGYVWNAHEHLRNAHFNASSAKLNDDDEGTEMAWNGFKKAIEGVKEIRVSTDENENRKFQFKRYHEYHKAFNAVVGGFSPEKIENQTYMKELRDYGFSTPLCLGEKSLEGRDYENIVENDFKKYMSNTGTTEQTKATTATNVVDLISTARASMETDTEKQKKAA